VNRVFGLGQATLGILFPVLGQFSDFHGNLNKAHGGRAVMSDQPLAYRDGLTLRLAATHKV
jgi:hypothetical protein